MIDADQIVMTLVTLLENHRGAMTQAMQSVGYPGDMGMILPIFSRNVDVGDYPVVMIDARMEESDWRAMQQQAQQSFSVEIHAMVHYDDELVRHRTMRKLAGAVRDALTARNTLVPIVDTDLVIYYDDKFPVPRVEYGLADMSVGFVSAALISWAGDVSIVVDDELSGTLPIVAGRSNNAYAENGVIGITP